MAFWIEPPSVVESRSARRAMAYAVAMAREYTLPERMLHEQVRMLARNVPALVVGTLVLAVGTAALLLMNQQSVQGVLAWLAGMVLLCGVRLWGARRYAQAQPGVEQAARWARWFVIASAAAGLMWGSLTALFFSPDDPHTQGVVVMVLAAIVASATQSLGAYFPAHLAFGIPALVPFALRCLLSGELRTATLGVLALAFLVMAELFARRIAAAIADAMRLRFENESLAGELRLEKERAEAANQAKTRFLATASHDLRQPIHALALYVPALQGLAELPRERLEPRTLGSIAMRMQAALQTMNQLLGRLLDVSRLDAGAVEVNARAVPLAPMFNAVIDQVSETARGKGLRLRLHEPGLWVQTDPAVLHTILSNLVSNAVRYTQRGGVLLAARRRGGLVLLQVWDSGIGIAPDEQARITEEFFQARNAHEDASQTRGFGLGLAIAQRSAQLLDARLRWRSVLGRGSVFEIALAWAEAPATPGPVAAPMPAPEPTPEPPPMARAPTASGPRVLLVDEDDDILASMAFLLRTWGYQALPAHNLAEALQVAARAAGPLHAALIDFHLAPQESGLAVAAGLRVRIDTGLPMAIVTGDTTPEVMAAVRQAGLTLLHKPASAESVQAFLASARAAH
jgi:signal transduction histidine kinase/ActR/RegA family two-component response regulator